MKKKEEISCMEVVSFDEKGVKSISYMIECDYTYLEDLTRADLERLAGAINHALSISCVDAEKFIPTEDCHE